MENLSGQTFNSLLTLGAVLFGFLLGTLSELLKSICSARRKRKLLRQLIALEVRGNISAINAYWESLLSAREEWKNSDGDFMHIQLALVVAASQLPALFPRAWEANMAEVTSAFGSNELESLWDFFAKVERLKVLYEFFRRSQSNMVEMSRHYDTTGTVGRATAQVLAGLTFRENVKVQSKEFKTTIEELLHFEPPG